MSRRRNRKAQADLGLLLGLLLLGGALCEFGVELTVVLVEPDVGGQGELRLARFLLLLGVRGVLPVARAAGVALDVPRLPAVAAAQLRVQLPLLLLALQLLALLQRFADLVLQSDNARVSAACQFGFSSAPHRESGQEAQTTCCSLATAPSCPCWLRASSRVSTRRH